MEEKAIKAVQKAIKESIQQTRKSNGYQFLPVQVYATLREILPDFTPEFWAEAEPWCCPACWHGIPNNERQGEYPGALSRRGDYYVCSDCGNREALEDFAGLTVEEV